MVKDFGEYWDDLADEKAAKTRANNVLKYVKKYNANAKSVLELGLGSGNVLKCFPKKYELYGLDTNKNYIKLAHKKMPKGNFFVSSMHNFSINKKFDIIFSIFDSINFLENFSQWKSTFKNVNKHLDNQGVFIFDTYTPKMLEKAKNWSIFSREKFGFMWDKGIVRGNKLTWHFSIFERKKGKNYELNEYSFHERIFPVDKIEKELKKYFKIMEKIDGENLKKPSKETFRLMYVVKKRDVR